MNTIQKIEGATLVSIAGLCAAAVFSIVFQSTAVAAPVTKTSASAMNRAAIVQLAPVVVIGKRMTAAQKAAINQ